MPRDLALIARVHLRLTEAELVSWRAAADGEGVALSAWIRRAVNAAGASG